MATLTTLVFHSIGCPRGTRNAAFVVFRKSYVFQLVISSRLKRPSPQLRRDMAKEREKGLSRATRGP